MSKKRNRDRSNFMGSSDDFSMSDTSLSNLEQIDRGIYGDIEAVDSSRLIAEPIDIFSIYPDPTQPRRILPANLRQYVEQGSYLANTMPDLWSTWESSVNSTRETPINVKDLIDKQSLSTQTSSEIMSIDDDDVATEEFAPNPIEAILLEVIHLAASIVRDGLTNPITVVSSGPYHVIETGERRWLAYHLLHYITQDADYAQIPARVVHEFNVWRQASENNARQNLNAIGKARQFSLLMMDLWADDPKSPKPFILSHEFETDQEFYAQIGDMRPPYGKADQLLNALGAQTSATFTRCRKLLQLPDAVWEIGDLMSLPEDTLLKLEQLPDDKAIDIAHQMYESQTINLGDLMSEKKSKSGSSSDLDVVFTRTYKQIPKLRKSLTMLSPKERNHLLDELQLLIDELR